MTLIKDKQRTILLTSSILLLSVVTITPALQSAFAVTDCSQSYIFWGGRCRGDQTNEDNHSGMKATIKITDIVTSSDCSPNNNGFAAVAIWMVFPNGAWIETGTAQGKIDGTCYTDEREYLAWTRTSSHTTYQEKHVRDISRGDSIRYQISDTDHDKTWQVISDGTTRINLVTAYSKGTKMITGVEANDDATFIPKTKISSIKYLENGAWHKWQSGSNSNDLEGWIKDCKNNSKIKVGIGGDAKC